MHEGAAVHASHHGRAAGDGHEANLGRRRMSQSGRMRRGDVRPLLVKALAAGGPGHGYELMRRLEEWSGGIWRPSPGSVYPTLQLLEDEGLVRSTEADGRRVYELTDAGQVEAQAVGSELPWDHGSAGADQRTLHEELRQLHLAVRQISVAGDDAALGRATALVRETRQAIYRILADG
jgi:DNA-binding PadR family transcriptional regulator